MSYSNCVVSLDAAHSMIALPVEAPVFQVRGDHGVTGTDGAPGEPRVYEEWGYAERAWYLEKRQGFTGCSVRSCGRRRASSKSGFMKSIWAERTQKPPVEAFRFQISEVGYRSLRSYLRATIASEEPVGIVGNSRFCVARPSYHLFHHCHHYTAKGLREAGLPISMWGSLDPLWFLPSSFGASYPSPNSHYSLSLLLQLRICATG